MINAEATMKISSDGENMQEVFSMLGEDRVNTMQIGQYLQYLTGKYLTFDGKYVKVSFEWKMQNVQKLLDIHILFFYFK